MDGISAAASVAGVTAAGIQLSKCLYDLCATVKGSGQEIQDIANNVSLLSMVLEELDGVLFQDELHYKPQLQHAAQKIVLRCAVIFKDIKKHTGTDQSPKGKKFSEKAAWYFKRERVKPLQTSLESLKSTLNVLLHVVQLAKTTNNVEEYPGVKPIGHWYVRKERRGLVCLVIDNRHTVDRLESLEKEALQATENSIEDEQPISFADIFPLSPASSKRGESPERKFVVSFRSRASRRDLDYEQDEDNRRSRPGPALPDDSHHVIASSSEQGPSRQDPPDPALSRLILSIIPHKEADSRLGSGPNVAGSVFLEAKAEETVDALMRQWTHVDPEYFTDDDQSLASSTEDLPSFQLNICNSESSAEERYHGRDGKFSSLKCSRSRKASQAKRHHSTHDYAEGPTSNYGEKQDETPSLWDRRRHDMRKNLSGLPTAQWARDTRPQPTDSGYQSAQTPTSPASPYGYSKSPQCPNCPPIPLPGPNVGTFPDHSDSTRHSEPTKGGDNLPINRALEVVERLSEFLDHPSLQSVVPEDPCSKLEEVLRSKAVPVQPRPSNVTDAEAGRPDDPQSSNTTQNAEAVTLKDCLGRTFILPIQTCRTWPEMENLIRRSFSRIESMNLQITRGDYDVLSPTGDIILPEIWNTVIQPGWVVELRFGSPPNIREPKEGSLVSQAAAASATESTSPPPAMPNLWTRSDTQFVKLKRRSLAWMPGRRTSVNRLPHSES